MTDHRGDGAFLPGDRATRSGAAVGPLRGLRFAAKDVFDVVGTVTGFGQPDWARTHAPARANAAVVDHLLNAGADLVGKTVCDELCYSLTGDNVHFPPTVNVAAPGRVPGGSSSGSAVAVAAGHVDFALGTDCGGSVRVPASYCGIYGVRPTHDRVSVSGVAAFAPLFDVVGWFARDLATLADIGRVLLGPEPARHFRRLILPVETWDGLDDPVVGPALKEVLESWRGEFDSVEQVHLQSDDADEWRIAFQTLQGRAVWNTLGDWVEATEPSFGPGIAERFAIAAAVTDDEVAAAELVRSRARSRVLDLLGEDGLLCVPTTPHIAPQTGLPTGEVEVAARNSAMRTLCTAGLVGLPQLSIPLRPRGEGPVGISLIGPRGSDAALIERARRLPVANGPSGRKSGEESHD